MIIYSEKKPEAVKASRWILNFLKENKLDAFALNAREALEKGLSSDLDAVIALGGDGTLLKAVKALPRKDTPILGINYGRGGYLMEAEASEMEEAIKRLIDGRYSIEEVFMLSIKMDGKSIGDALNEVYISATTPGKIIEAEIRSGEEFLMSLVADALIISTPVGSTAYAFSAGGPIVDQRLRAAIMVPVCPLTSARPLISSLSKKIEISVFGEAGVQVLIDGFIKELAKESAEIMVEESKERVRFIRLKAGDSFARRIGKRLR